MTSPIPVSDDPIVDRKQRIRSAQRVLSMAYTLAPEMRKIHEIKAVTAEGIGISSSIVSQS